MTRKARQPVTLKHLDRFNSFTNKSMKYFDHTMLKAAVSAAFFALLRSSENTCSKIGVWYSDTELGISVLIRGNFGEVSLKIKSSKTEGLLFHLTRLDSEFCPVVASESYVSVTPSAK